MKKTEILIFSLLFTFTQLSFSQTTFGDSKKINDSWKFHLGEVSNAEQANFNDSNWENIDIPYDWGIKQPLNPNNASCQGFLPGGIGWFRKTIEIPANKKGENVFLYFEGVYDRSNVYINGHLIANRPNGFISFMADATPYINFGGKNTIAVKINHNLQADLRWYSGSGIYRNVWLTYSQPIHIAQWGVYAYPVVKGNQGTLNIEVDVTNATNQLKSVTVKNELFNPNGEIVGTNEQAINVQANFVDTLRTKITIQNPKLWDLENSNLYQLKTTIVANGKTIDQATTTTGFRTFTFDANKGFFLNGKNMKMKGVCIHHDAGVLGSAFYPEVWRRRLLTLKEIGVNAIRTSHNPQAPDFYRLCDELGFLVFDEAYDEWEYNKRKWLKGWNVGKAGLDGSADIFKVWGATDMSDLVKRDRNHLSIFAWSIGNEVDYPNDPYSLPILSGGADGFTQPIFGGYKKDAPNAMELGEIAKKLVHAVKEFDKSRPVSAGLAGVAMSNETEYPNALDITGYNYTEGRYQQDHKKYPKRIIFGSENRHELSTWKAVRDNDFIFGQFLWTGIDYLGESGSWPSRGFYSGLIDFGGFIKPRGYYRQALWTEKPVIYAGTYISPLQSSENQMKDVWSQTDGQNKNGKDAPPSMDAFSIWNYNDGDIIRVVCYTNAAQAKLLLNGEEIGEMKPYNDKYGIIYWDIPYKAGKLEAIGYDTNNKVISKYEIITAGEAKTMNLILADKSVKYDEIAQIAIQIVDKNGIPVMLSKDAITCEVSNNGELLGLEASDNEDMSDYTDNVQNAYHGRIIAYVKAKEKSGEIKIKFSLPEIKSAQTAVKILSK